MRTSPSEELRGAGAGWPALPLADWRETYATLHMLTQIVGKLRLRLGPPQNHSWHVALYVTSRGLTTGPMANGGRVFQVDFDFVDHALRLDAGAHGRRTIALGPRPVADYWAEVHEALAALGVDVEIHGRPNEVEDPIPFADDRTHRSYDPAAAARFHGALAQSDRVLRRFRTGFIGKCSPVHFFWGSFDLAYTRFSGRPAPVHPGGVPNLPDPVTREAYSHEVSSVGWWPGGGAVEEAAYYAYAYPQPDGFADAAVPEGAYYLADMGEFILPYDAVRSAPDPDALLLDFCRATYDAAADLGGWDRKALER